MHASMGERHLGVHVFKLLYTLGWGIYNYMTPSLTCQMATLPKALSLLEELRSASIAAATRDLEEVTAFAQSQGFSEELLWWDVSFWSERLREAK